MKIADMKYSKKVRIQTQFYQFFIISLFVIHFIEMQNPDLEIEELKQKFVQLDDNQDGFINKVQLEAFMKKEKIFNIPIWKLNEVMKIHQDKINQEDFIIWIMACRSGFEDLAKMKFKLANDIKSIKSTGPSAGAPSLKKSVLRAKVNKQKEEMDSSSFQHFLKLKIGIDKQEDHSKRDQIHDVLGRKPAEIYFFLKFKALDKGDVIAEKLSQMTQLAMALLSQIGQTAQPIAQSLTITSKWVNLQVYLVIQLNNSFFNMLLRFLNEAIQELSPQGKCSLEAKVSSDFSKVLKPNFDPLNQSINIDALLEIGGVSMIKLKQKLIEDFQTLDTDTKTNTLFLFLFEEINLSLIFTSLKQLFSSFGFDEADIPKPGKVGQQIKEMQVRQIISQFIPEVDYLFNTLSQNCKPEGSARLSVSSVGAEILFNFNIEGAFGLL